MKAYALAASLMNTPQKTENGQQAGDSSANLFECMQATGPLDNSLEKKNYSMKYKTNIFFLLLGLLKFRIL